MAPKPLNLEERIQRKLDKINSWSDEAREAFGLYCAAPRQSNQRNELVGKIPLTRKTVNRWAVELFNDPKPEPKPWTAFELSRIRLEYRYYMPDALVRLKWPGRTPKAVRTKAHRMGLSRQGARQRAPFQTQTSALA